MMNIVQLCLGLLMLAGGLFMFSLFLRALRQRIAMARWPQVPGIVRAHRVHSHSDGKYHRPVVTVQYASAGRQRLVQCQSPTRLGFSHTKPVHEILARFPVGTSVKVYVDPNKPVRAFLYLPELSALLLLGLGSMFLLLVGIGMLGPAWQ